MCTVGQRVSLSITGPGPSFFNANSPLDAWRGSEGLGGHWRASEDLRGPWKILGDLSFHKNGPKASERVRESLNPEKGFGGADLKKHQKAS